MVVNSKTYLSEENKLTNEAPAHISCSRVFRALCSTFRLLAKNEIHTYLFFDLRLVDLQLILILIKEYQILSAFILIQKKVKDVRVPFENFGVGGMVFCSLPTCRSMHSTLFSISSILFSCSSSLASSSNCIVV